MPLSASIVSWEPKKLKTTIARVLAVLLILGSVVAGLTPAANAAVTSAISIQAAPVSLESGTDAGEPSVCSSNTGYSASGSNNLPVTRWGGASSEMHKLLLSQDHLGNILNSAQRDVLITNGMSFGNTMWGIGTSMASFAINMCMIDSFGGAADKIASTIGETLMNSGILTLLVVASLGAVVFRGARGNGVINWRPLVSKVVVLGVFAAMLGGAMASTGGGADGSSAPFKPGFASPGWIVTKTSNVIGSLASVPAAALANGVNGEDIYTSGSNGSASSTLSCDRYLWSMKDKYQGMYGNSAMQMNAGVPLILSNMWEDTGLYTWRTAQFGTTEGSSLDSNSWCRLLEWNSGQQLTNSFDDHFVGTAVRGHIIGSIGANAPAADSPVWKGNAFSPEGDEQVDRSLIAWSACTLNANSDPALQESWSIRKVFLDNDSKNKLKDTGGPEACAKWWGSDAKHENDGIKAFEWPTTTKEVNERTDDRGLQTFINTLHGTSNSQGIIAVNTYMIAALSMLIAFGSISIALLLAKAAMLLMMIFCFVMLISVLFPNARAGKLGSSFKSLLGIIIYVFMIQLLFAIIALITGMLQEAGDAFMNKGDAIHLLWTGLAPLAAIILIHMMFTKVMKLPSPFSIAGGLAWGGLAAGAGGAALASAAGMISRGRRRATDSAMNAGRRAGSAGINKMKASVGLGGGQAGPRRGAATPLTEAQTAGTKGKLGDQEKPGSKSSRRNAGDPSSKANAGGTEIPEGVETGQPNASEVDGSEEARRGAATEGVEQDDIAQNQPSGQDSNEGAQPRSQEPRRKGSPRGRENPATAGRIETEDLATTSLRNSQLGKGAESQIGDGHMTGTERQNLLDAARRERTEAEEWQDAERARMGLPPIDRSAKGRMRQVAAERFAKAKTALRPRQLPRTAAKTMGKTLKYGAIGTGLLAASAFSAPVAGGLLAAYGAKKVIGAAAKKRNAERLRTDTMVDSYRAAQRTGAATPSQSSSNGHEVDPETLQQASQAAQEANAQKSGGASEGTEKRSCPDCLALIVEGTPHTCNPADHGSKNTSSNDGGHPVTSQMPVIGATSSMEPATPASPLPGDQRDGDSQPGRPAVAPSRPETAVASSYAGGRTEGPSLIEQTPVAAAPAQPSALRPRSAEEHAAAVEAERAAVFGESYAPQQPSAHGAHEEPSTYTRLVDGKVPLPGSRAGAQEASVPAAGPSNVSHGTVTEPAVGTGASAPSSAEPAGALKSPAPAGAVKDTGQPARGRRSAMAQSSKQGIEAVNAGAGSIPSAPRRVEFSNSAGTPSAVHAVPAVPSAPLSDPFATPAPSTVNVKAKPSTAGLPPKKEYRSPGGEQVGKPSRVDTVDTRKPASPGAATSANRAASTGRISDPQAPAPSRATTPGSSAERIESPSAPSRIESTGTRPTAPAGAPAGTPSAVASAPVKNERTRPTGPATQPSSPSRIESTGTRVPTHAGSPATGPKTLGPVPSRGNPSPSSGAPAPSSPKAANLPVASGSNSSAASRANGSAAAPTNSPAPSRVESTATAPSGPSTSVAAPSRPVKSMPQAARGSQPLASSRVEGAPVPPTGPSAGATAPSRPSAQKQASSQATAPSRPSRIEGAATRPISAPGSTPAVQKSPVPSRVEGEPIQPARQPEATPAPSRPAPSKPASEREAKLPAPTTPTTPAPQSMAHRDSKRSAGRTAPTESAPGSKTNRGPQLAASSRPTSTGSPQNGSRLEGARADRGESRLGAADDRSPGIQTVRSGRDAAAQDRDETLQQVRRDRASRPQKGKQ